MFQIVSNSIVFDGKDVAQITLPTGSLRDRVETLLECCEIGTPDSQDAIRAEEYEAGISEGRDREWEICFDALEGLRRLDPQKIGLTDTQLEQVLDILVRIDPR